MHNHLKSLIEIYVELQKGYTKYQEELCQHVTVDTPFVHETLLSIEIQIRKLVGMPLKDVLGEFVFDYWFDLLYSVGEGEKTVKEIIPRFIKWEEEFPKE